MFKKSLIIAVVGFAVGYLTNHLLQESVADVQIVKSTQQDCEQPSASADTVKQEAPLSQPAASVSSLAAQPSTAAPQKNTNAIHSEPDTSVDQPQAEKIPVVDANSRDVKKPDVITDAEIDAVLPAPFNEQLKGMQGYFRDKYKEFANAERGDDWDILMKGRIEDAIYSNPYGKSLTIDSLVCKRGICEIRLYETKYGAWSLILAEMQLQTWWGFNSIHSSGFAVQFNGENVTGHYVLIDRKRN